MTHPSTPSTAADRQQVLFVGSYGSAGDVAIAVLTLSRTGELAYGGGIGGIDAPSYLTFDAQRERLYAVSEVASGALVSYAFHRGAGRLTELGRTPTAGSMPCYVSQSANGRTLYVTNYEGGSVAVLPIDGATGAAMPLSSVTQHSGHGPVVGRQDAPHPHMVREDVPTGDIWVADLGVDAMIRYRKQGGTLLRQDELRAQAGAGPRHFTFHPNGHALYVLHELNCTLAVYLREGPDVPWSLHQVLPLLPRSYQGANIAADVHLSHAARYLYASNRGHDSIAVFRVDPAGALTAIGHADAAGAGPRSFLVMSDDRYLIVANQVSNAIDVLSVGDDGMPAATGQRCAMKEPVCVRTGGWTDGSLRTSS